jgi:hypothetical protein
MTKEQEDTGFRVTDKRLFREDGEVREEARAEETRQEKKSGPFKIADDGKPQAQPAPEAGAAIDFSSYILSYYSQGLMFLGEAPNPFTNKKEEDLESARHMIEILAMLQEKTRGNLSHEEDQLLDSVLYELRMRFMTKTNKIKL